MYFSDRICGVIRVGRELRSIIKSHQLVAVVVPDLLKYIIFSVNEKLPVKCLINVIM